MAKEYTFDAVIDDIVKIIPNIRKTIKANRRKGLLDEMTFCKKNIITQYDENNCRVAFVKKDGDIIDLFSFTVGTEKTAQYMDGSVLSENYELLRYVHNDIVEIPLEKPFDNTISDISGYYCSKTNDFTIDTNGLREHKFRLETADDSDAIMFTASTVQDDLVHQDVLKSAWVNIQKLKNVTNKFECLDVVEMVIGYFPKDWSSNVLYPRISFD